ncbi:trans-sialidase, putative [Trypanosoma cruzi]|nr:trans-sialidase, putative [Trypanosoma cruzi]
MNDEKVDWVLLYRNLMLVGRVGPADVEDAVVYTFVFVHAVDGDHPVVVEQIVFVPRVADKTLGSAVVDGDEAVVLDSGVLLFVAVDAHTWKYAVWWGLLSECEAQTCSNQSILAWRTAVGDAEFPWRIGCQTIPADEYRAADFAAAAAAAAVPQWGKGRPSDIWKDAPLRKVVGAVRVGAEEVGAEEVVAERNSAPPVRPRPPSVYARTPL